jgi:non-ribosomal peptide synthetase-like protein
VLPAMTKGKYLHTLFQEQAYSYPQKTALLYEDKEISYLELEQRSNQLMWQLKDRGIGAGDYVAILFERNDYAIIAMLAILKMGAAYVPLEPDYPNDRINFILNDCQAKLLLSTSVLLKNHPCPPCVTLAYDKELAQIERRPISQIESDIPNLAEDSICYVIYTSGTTGRPKGVAIEHRSTFNYIQQAKQVYDLRESDRVYHGFSIAFDASIEEIWLTLSVGATLFPTNDRAIRAGAGLVEFLNKYKITFLSTTPTLLSTLEPAVPSLRLIVLGGEVCKQELITRWSRAKLRILNTYGPTEATIVTTYHECDPSKTVTIGRPLPSYETYLLNKELQPVCDEEEGELCIGGVCLARGYINQPELNAKKFIDHREYGRLYRTGDLCKKLPNGEFQFLGRLDNQVKLRGFRIELGEIERVIIDYPGIHNVVVTVKAQSDDMNVLVAYLVLNNKSQINKSSLANFLKTRLANYMVPSFYEIIDEIPLMHSGKVDHQRLPMPKESVVTTEGYTPPKNEIEEEIASAWRELFNCNQISIDSDFFYDLGGHSLLAARVVSLLRKKSRFCKLSMKDIYQHPTIEKLAIKLGAYAKEAVNDSSHYQEKTTEDKAKVQSRFRFCAIMQAIGCYLQFAIISWEFLVAITISTFVLEHYSLYSLEAAGIIIAVFIGFPIVILAFVIAMKWLLLGRIKPGNYPLWGSYYIRWWFVLRVQKTLAPVMQLASSPLINIFCRLMGAKIGRNCYIATDQLFAFDLLSIGENSSINQEAFLAGFTVEDGFLKIGSITIGKNCYVGTRSVLEINTVMEDDSSLGDLSKLSENSSIPRDSYYHGSPAREKETKNSNRSGVKPAVYSRSRAFGFGLLHYLALIFVEIVYLLAFIPGLTIMNYFYTSKGLLSNLFLGVPIASLCFMLCFCLSIIILNKVLAGGIKPGTYQLRSWLYLRKWIVDKLMEFVEFDALAESLYFPIFLRLLGAKIGKRVEIAELPRITPSLLTMKDESFVASGSILGVPRVHLGYVEYAPIELGYRSFIGSSAVLTPGCKLGNYSFIASLSISPDNDDAAKSNTAWLGSPSVYMPRREVRKTFSEEETFKPPKHLYFFRATFELLRIITPISFYFLILLGFFSAADFLYLNYSEPVVYALFPFFTIATILATVGLMIGIKWLLMGRYKVVVKPLWSLHMWKNDLINQLHNIFLNRLVLEPLTGSPYVNFILRLLGVKIGKRAFINAAHGILEYDLVRIGDDVAVNLNCTLLTHLFEDRIYKTGPLLIEEGCCIGSSSTLIYDSIMGKYSSLGSLSLLMKGEHLPENSHWEGIPSEYNVRRKRTTFS